MSPLTGLFAAFMVSLINSATGCLSGIATVVFLLSFILLASKWIERIALAALIGVMFVVCQKTFASGSFRLFGKVPRYRIADDKLA
nr:hypothetical protein [Massilia violaceinigra]